MNKLLKAVIISLMNDKFTGLVKNQKGSVLVFVTIVFIILLAFTALAIDVGQYMVARNELQNIADGAALAACRELGTIYQNHIPSINHESYVCNGDSNSDGVDDATTIKNAAVNVGSNNSSIGLSNVNILSADVIIGTWVQDSDPPFNPTLNQPNAVQVTVRREGNVNPSILTFFAKILGINTMDASMNAIAALTGQSTTEPGEIELPIGISHYFFLDGNFCNEYIKFYPTNDPDSCSGWNTYEESPANANDLRDILENDVQSPGTIAGDTEFTFIGGTLNTHIFDATFELYKNKGYDTQSDGETPVALDENDAPIVGPLDEAEYSGWEPLYEDDGTTPALYADGTPRHMHRWETTVPVYGWEDCSNPSGPIIIVGYTKIVISDVKGPPNHTIVGKVLCDQYSEFDTRGSGGNFGLKGTIPGLVE